MLVRVASGVLKCQINIFSVEKTNSSVRPGQQDQCSFVEKEREREPTLTF